MKVVIAHGHTSIEIFHSLVPFILAETDQQGIQFSYVDYRLKDIFTLDGDVLILVRKFHDGKTADDEIERQLSELRKGFTKIVYFDDSAAASVILFNIVPFVDNYWKRAILKDTELYNKRLYGGHVFSNYYHTKHGLNDEEMTFYSPKRTSEDLCKIKLAWNIGIGALPTSNAYLRNIFYPQVRRLVTGLTILPSIKPVSLALNNFVTDMKYELSKEVSLQNKDEAISARFNFLGYRKSIGYQRRLFSERISGSSIYLTGTLNRREFTRETFNTLGVLSPFGWGEVCYRDFEAALGGALLIKPNMSHIQTWPNIFTSSDYHSVDWDGNELLGISEEIKNSQDVIIEKINRSRNVYSLALGEMKNRALDMIKQI